MPKANGLEARPVAVPRVLEQYLAAKLDAVIVNNEKPANKLLSAYKKEKAEFVKPDTGTREALISEFVYKKSSSDKLKRSFLRHDADKTAKLIWNIIHQ